MVALDRLLEAVQVPGEVLLVRPSGAVDALQHRVLLGTAEVRPGDPHQFEVAESPGGRHVRAATHVHERRGVAVEADGLAAGDFAVRIVPRRREVHERPLVRMFGHEFHRLGHGQLEPLERLVGGDDLAHLRLDRFEIGI